MKRILAAVDRSEISALVIARAAELARLMGARVRLLRAIELPTAPPAAWVDSRIEELLASERRALTARLDEVPEPLRDGAIVEFGSPADTICEAARAYDAELVVIGAPRHHVLARALGTTAARVVNNGDRPVFIVRPVPTSSATERGIDVAPNARAGELLLADHKRLDKVYVRLLAAYEAGDWTGVRAEWDTLDSSLRDHMETEERYVFPLFRTVDTREADALLAEHVELRRLLGAFGVRVDLHSFGREEATALIVALRAHASREERLLYPWMDATMASNSFEPPVRRSG